MQGCWAQRGGNLITLLPCRGAGKTTTCELVASATGLRHLNVGDLVKQEELHNGWDEEFECWVIDEDKVGRACRRGALGSHI